MSPHIDTVLGMKAVSRLRELVEERCDAIVAVGASNGELLWVSEPGARWMFGRTLSDFQGNSRFDFVHPDDVADCRRKHQRALEGQTVRHTVRALTANGGWQRVATVMWRVEAPSSPLIVSVTVLADAQGADRPSGASQRRA